MSKNRWTTWFWSTIYFTNFYSNKNFSDHDKTIMIFRVKMEHDRISRAKTVDADVLFICTDSARSVSCIHYSHRKLRRKCGRSRRSIVILWACRSRGPWRSQFAMHKTRARQDWNAGRWRCSFNCKFRGFSPVWESWTSETSLASLIYGNTSILSEVMAEELLLSGKTGF